jgi:3-methyladenine DNA glycosylase AlkC
VAEPFKNLVNPALVRAAVPALQRAWPAFDGARFASLACEGLEGLELKARAMHVCAALESTLPADFAAAADVIEAALAPAEPADSITPTDDPAGGLRGWILWPVGEYIARQGQEQPRRALAALHALTQRFTAEFAIRPFIVRHPALVFATLQGWTTDASAHVRRLVSEGSRPRLPWGLRLQSLVLDPSPTLPLLAALQDDPSAYVRRSVANHLNDIAKDHPQVVVDWLRAHLPGAPAPRRALLRHASRTLVKQGHPGVMKAWGLGSAWRGEALLTLTPRRVTLGGNITFKLHLRSTNARAQKLAVDYAVHHVKADGSRRPKVFKGWTIDLPAHGEATLVKRHSLRPVTTRRYHPGEHGLVVQVNGRPVVESTFTLVMPRPARAR